MKTVQINKVKVRIFEETELKEKLGMCEKEIQLVTTYQRTFPELLQDEEGFCISGETLCNQLGVGTNFNNWLLLQSKSKEGKLIKYKCVENVDYINDWNFDNVKFTREEVENMNPQQRSRQGIKNVIKLTLECAKKIAMRQNNEQGDIVCDYFILMEKTLRNYEKWVEIRIPERKNANVMRSKIKEWCIKNGYDANEGSCAREFNMINIAVTGNTALGIRLKLGYSDKQTREHLETKKNAIIDKMQEINITLLELNMSFEERTKFIEDKCNKEYNDLKFAV